jgi:hypothetical protein
MRLIVLFNGIVAPMTSIGIAKTDVEDQGFRAVLVFVPLKSSITCFGVPFG